MNTPPHERETGYSVWHIIKTSLSGTAQRPPAVGGVKSSSDYELPALINERDTGATLKIKEAFMGGKGRVDEGRPAVGE